MTSPDGLRLIDRHRHVEGSLRPSTVIELAARDPARFGAVSRADLVAAEPYDGLPAYLARIDVAAAARRSTDLGEEARLDS